MWAELGHGHFLYVPAVSKHSKLVNGMDGMTRALKMFLNGTVRLFVFSIQSSVYGAITVAKVSLFSTWTLSTVSFTLCMRRNQPVYVAVNKHW